MNKTGFIAIPLLITIIVSVIVISTVTTGVVLHREGKLTPLIASVSQVFQKTEEVEPEIKSEEPKTEQEQPLLEETNQEENSQTAQELEQAKLEAEKAEQKAEQAKAEAERLKAEQEAQRLAEEQRRKEGEAERQEELERQKQQEIQESAEAEIPRVEIPEIEKPELKPIDGGWSKWSNWSNCQIDKSELECGEAIVYGEKIRTRTCNNPEPAHSGRDCIGPSQETKGCEIVYNYGNCPDGYDCIDNICEEKKHKPIDGGWSEWSNWGECQIAPPELECGEGTVQGEKVRTRTCDNPEPAYSGKDCVSPSRETESCEIVYDYGSCLGGHDCIDNTCKKVTEVGGIISLDTTWTLENSPYIVDSNIGVEKGATLAIESGVEIKFRGDYKIQVAGSLIASGDESKRIVFSADKGNTDFWQGIEFLSRSSGILNYVVLNDISKGVISTESIPQISHIETNAGVSFNHPPPTLSELLFQNNKVASLSITNFGNVIIKNNDFTSSGYYGYAISVTGGVGITITNNKIGNGRSNGIYAVGLGDVVVSHNTVENSNQGISVSVGGNGSGTITYNLITNSDIGLTISMRSSSGMNINNNNFIQNRLYNLKIHEVTSRTGQDISTINAQNNYWDTTNESEIRNKIYDRNDDLQVRGIIDYSEFLLLEIPNIGVQ